MQPLLSRWTRTKFLIAVSLLAPNSFAGYPIVGEGPSIVNPEEPRDAVTSTNIFNSVDGKKANVILFCGVSATTTSSIVKWYKNEILLNATTMTLALNVSDPKDPREHNSFYHCEVTNMIGSQTRISATVRSRHANVSFAYFAGFQSTHTTHITLQVLLGDVVAMECDVLPANPTPQIQWYNENGPVSNSSMETSKVIYLEDGQYLFITGLTTERIAQQFYCVVTNVLISGSMRSPITYTLNNSLPVGQVMEFKPIGNLVGIPGEMLSFVYVAGFGGPNVLDADEIEFTCKDTEILNFTLFIGRVSFIVPEPGENNQLLTITCSYTTSYDNFTEVTDVTGTLSILQPARIISPKRNDTELIDRDIIVGEREAKVFQCLFEGIPEPNLIWYYNGKPTSRISGINEDGTQLTIADPQISHSGIYQCFVRNIVNGRTIVDQRTWTLEIREHYILIVRSILSTNPMAIPDHLLNILFIAPPDSTELVITAKVISDPCPLVKWVFNKTNILMTDIQYNINDSCSDDFSYLFYTFTLTIINMTHNTSGFYSIIFDNGFSQFQVPAFFVTVKAPVQVLGSSLIVDGDDTSCLLAGQNVIVSCHVVGFPRPRIRFRKDIMELIPSQSDRIAMISPNQIVLSKVGINDAGLYSCEAITGDGELVFPDSTSEEIYCTRARIASHYSTPTYLMEGQPLEITCIVEGEPIPTIAWTKDGMQLSYYGSNFRISNMDNISVLTINSSTTNDLGMYTCTATNLVIIANSTILVEIPPIDQQTITTLQDIASTEAPSSNMNIAVPICAAVLSFSGVYIVIVGIASFVIIHRQRTQRNYRKNDLNKKEWKESNKK